MRAARWRSLLFVPGHRADRFAKALAAGADAVCVDLEDAVPPADKAAARRDVIASLGSLCGGTVALGVRVNALRSMDGLADLAALGGAARLPDFVMVPKTADPIELAIIADILPGIALWPIVESAAGLACAAGIARGRDVAGLLFGAVDFAAEIGCTLEWEPLLFARATLAATRAGAQLLDVPSLDVADHAALEASSRRARALGFTGRACIHPAQVAAVNRAFTPSGEELAQARRVIDALAQAGGKAALLDGKLIEKPVALAAERLLQRARP